MTFFLVSMSTSTTTCNISDLLSAKEHIKEEKDKKIGQGLILVPKNIKNTITNSNSNLKGVHKGKQVPVWVCDRVSAQACRLG